MRTISETELQAILHPHKAWLQNDGGVRANFREADLRGANFRGADLFGANFREADLRGADLREADLRGADLRGADLRGADLRGADLDFSSGFSLSCRGTNIQWDDRAFAQYLYLITRQDNRYLSDENRTWLESIPENIRNSFCTYRTELPRI